ncbi:helix-turn-helix domain-containing protein [Lapidilactobacillus wuchangensis]|uniref:helix-turn-helix domain-containing protein n=1 Tax=Lapidilactobacillus wuchangensis TaxID=2486001 RepID=UPI000F795AEF|nr:AraC family transcriptional regulator [Lapidilactobacillus wuchangensis]
MENLQFSLNTPVHYLQSGQFTAELGWRHHQMTHQQDTELIIGLSGQVHLQIAEQTFHVGPGDILTVFPFETITGAQPTVEKSSFIWCHFIQHGNYQINVTEQKSANQISLPRFYHLNEFSQTVIAAQQLLDFAHNAAIRPLTSDYQTSLLILTLADAVRNQNAQATTHQTSLNEIKEWLRINLAQHQSLPEIAAQFFMNPDYLNRIFKRETGLTIMAYTNQLRLDYAKLLLLSTKESVKAISESAFFSDVKYFERLFKKKNHLTPNQYRQAYTHTFLNNNQVDPGVDLSAQVQQLEQQ